MNSYTSSLRKRSGSVGRGERDAGSSTFRTSYGPRDLPKPVSRMSRASSYDPFSTRSNMSSSMTTSYSRPSYTSNLSSMSHSYHPDYTSKTLTNRFGSSDQLNSLSYKSSYSPSNYTKYRPAEATRERSSYRASSTFSPRTPLSSSDSRRERDFTSTTRDFSSISLSKYRPDSSSYGFSSNTYSRPTSSYSIPSTSSSTYKPRVRFDYRSKTPGLSNSTTSETRLSRYDRDFRSMCPIEKRPEKAVDDVEKTFRKLYDRYVQDVNEKSEEECDARTIKSRSEDKLTSRDEIRSARTCISDDSFDETIAADFKTPIASPVEDGTPVASPNRLNERIIEDVKTVPNVIEREKPLKDNKSVLIEKSSKETFEEAHGDVQMMPAVIPLRQLKPAASAMDKLLRKDSLTIKLTDAIHKKKTAPEPTTKDYNIAKSKASSEISKSITSLEKTNSSSDGLKVSTKISKSLSPAPSLKSSNLSNKQSQCEKTNDSTKPASVSQRSSLSSTSLTSSKSSQAKEDAPCTSSESSRLRGTSSETMKSLSKPPTNILKIQSPMTAKKKPELTINVNAPEEPLTEVTIFAPKKIRSRSSSPMKKTENSQNYLTVDGKKSKDKMRRSASPLTTNSLEVGREERAHSEDTNDKKAIKKRRDLTRTLENLKEKLEDEQKKQQSSSNSEENKKSNESKQTVRPPLLLVTQPSMPSTPMSTSGTILWNSEPNTEFSEDDWTEEEDYESDSEFTISQTFKIPDRLPMGDLYPLRSPPSSRCSPFASDYDSDSSPPFLAANNESADSRGRVGQKFAVPPPTFTCSVSYDGQQAWDSGDDGSVHSCRDFDDIYTGRPTSSGLAYLTPSDEEESVYDEDSVDVGFTLKLVDRAARREDEEYTDDSEYYDDEEFTDEEYWDEDEEYDEEVEYSEEEIDEEELVSEIENSEMHSICESPELITISADLQEAEAFEFEEADEDFEMGTSFIQASPKEVTTDVIGADKYREVTYTRDMTILTEEEEISNLSVEKDELTKAKAKRITKDGRTEKADKSLIPSCVVPAEEIVTEATFTELPSDTALEANLQEHEETVGLMEVNVIPTFVKPQTEKLKEESTSRFSDRKPSTDFAKKAIIQPNKLETAKVQKIETKIGEKPKPKLVIDPTPKGETKSVASIPELETKSKLPEVKAEVSKAKSSAEVTSKATKDSKISLPTKEVEDKSNVRKSALNMTLEEAKKKAKADEDAAKIKARRFGTVSALMDKFKEEPKQPESITYKRSSRLASKETEERPRRKYEIVKPVINDEFDKQMEEIRAKMKSGSSQLQDQMKNLSKGISSTAEETKKRELEEKHKLLLNKTSGAFSEADREKIRWKERRDAEAEQELAKIEASKGTRITKQEVPIKPVEELKKEPKRTVRKIIRDKSPAIEKGTEKEKQEASKVVADTFQPLTKPPVNNTETISTSSNIVIKKVESKPSDVSSGEKKESPVPAVPRDMFRREKTPVVKPADTIKKPSAPKQDLIVDESNFDLLQAATQVATRRRKSIAELKQQKDKSNVQKPASPSRSKTDGAVSPKLGPKGEGAAATKIRNALGNVVNVPTDSKSPVGSEKSSSSRRYGTRRKTQEIVNESQQAKKKRKEQQRKNKFIRDPHDIDVLFGWDKENSFEKMERMFQAANNNKMKTNCASGIKRRAASKIWISDLMDIDKIYKPSEIRDIAASVDM